MADHVEVIFGANAAGFHRTAEGVQNKLKELVGLSEGLKGALLAAIGGFSVSAVVNHMAEFAKNLKDMSERLGISVKQTYNLKVAAREAGMEFEKWTTIRAKTETFLQNVVNLNPKAMMTAQRFGLTGQEKWSDALKKVLSTPGVDRGTIAGIVGNKDIADRLFGQKDTFLRGFAGKKDINAEAVDTMARFKLQLEFLVEEIERGLLPTLGRLVNWIEKYLIHGFGVGSVKEDAIKAAAEASGVKLSRFGPGGLVGTAANLGGMNKEQANLFLLEKFGIKGAAMFWHTYNQGLKELNTGEKEREADRKRRIDELENGQTQGRRVPNVPINEGQLQSNQFLKIGGLFGVDINYRLTRLQVEANEYLRQIRDALVDNKSTGDGDNSPLTLGAS